MYHVNPHENWQIVGDLFESQSMLRNQRKHSIHEYLFIHPVSKILKYVLKVTSP